jgi:hypothetical protein
MLLPGVNPAQPVSKNYPKTDLNDAFWLDEQSQKSGLYDARKHHEEYQEFIQSSHYRKNVLSCVDCHSPHAVAGKAPTEPRATCSGCHGNKYDVDKIMPGRRAPRATCSSPRTRSTRTRRASRRRGRRVRRSTSTASNQDPRAPNRRNGTAAALSSLRCAPPLPP